MYGFKHVLFGSEPGTPFLSSLEQRRRDEQPWALELAVQRLARDVERAEDRAPKVDKNVFCLNKTEKNIILNRKTLFIYGFKHVLFGSEPGAPFLSSLEQRRRDEQLRAPELAVQRLARDVEDRAPKVDKNVRCLNKTEKNKILNRKTLFTYVFKHVWFGPEPETLFLSSLEQRHRDEEQLRALERCAADSSPALELRLGALRQSSSILSFCLARFLSFGGAVASPKDPRPRTSHY